MECLEKFLVIVVVLAAIAVTDSGKKIKLKKIGEYCKERAECLSGICNHTSFFCQCEKGFKPIKDYRECRLANEVGDPCLVHLTCETSYCNGTYCDVKDDPNLYMPVVLAFFGGILFCGVCCCFVICCFCCHGKNKKKEEGV